FPEHPCPFHQGTVHDDFGGNPAAPQGGDGKCNRRHSLSRDFDNRHSAALLPHVRAISLPILTCFVCRTDVGSSVAPTAQLVPSHVRKFAARVKESCGFARLWALYCRSGIPGERGSPGYLAAIKARRRRARSGARNWRKALASIWRMRSRVTSNSCPI